MQLKSTKRDEHDEFKDKVYAALETGNAGRARTLLVEYADHFPEHAERLRAECIAAYGMAL
jgi:hypothetical protein